MSGSGTSEYSKENTTVSEPLHLFFDIRTMKHFSQQNREVVRQTMLRHEEIFRTQVQELHKLYQVQRSLMHEVHQRASDYFSAPSQAAAFQHPMTQGPLHLESKKMLWDSMEVSSAGQGHDHQESVTRQRLVLVKRKSQDIVDLTEEEKTSKMTKRELGDTPGSQNTPVRRRTIDLEQPPDDETDDELEISQNQEFIPEKKVMLSTSTASSLKYIDVERETGLKTSLSDSKRSNTAAPDPDRMFQGSNSAVLKIVKDEISTGSSAQEKTVPVIDHVKRASSTKEFSLSHGQHHGEATDPSQKKELASEGLSNLQQTDTTVGGRAIARWMLAGASGDGNSEGSVKQGSPITASRMAMGSSCKPTQEPTWQPNLPKTASNQGPEETHQGFQSAHISHKQTRAEESSPQTGRQSKVYVDKAIQGTSDNTQQGLHRPQGDAEGGSTWFPAAMFSQGYVPSFGVQLKPPEGCAAQGLVIPAFSTTSKGHITDSDSGLWYPQSGYMHLPQYQQPAIFHTQAFSSMGQSPWLQSAQNVHGGLYPQQAVYGMPTGSPSPLGFNAEGIRRGQGEVSGMWNSLGVTPWYSNFSSVSPPRPPFRKPPKLVLTNDGTSMELKLVPPAKEHSQNSGEAKASNASKVQDFSNVRDKKQDAWTAESKTGNNRDLTAKKTEKEGSSKGVLDKNRESLLTQDGKTMGDLGLTIPTVGIMSGNRVKKLADSNFSPQSGGMAPGRNAECGTAQSSSPSESQTLFDSVIGEPKERETTVENNKSSNIHQDTPEPAKSEAASEKQWVKIHEKSVEAASHDLLKPLLQRPEDFDSRFHKTSGVLQVVEALYTQARADDARRRSYLKDKEQSDVLKASSLEQVYRNPPQSDHIGVETKQMMKEISVSGHGSTSKPFRDGGSFAGGSIRHTDQSDSDIGKVSTSILEERPQKTRGEIFSADQDSKLTEQVTPQEKNVSWAVEGNILSDSKNPSKPKDGEILIAKYTEGSPKDSKNPLLDSALCQSGFSGNDEQLKTRTKNEPNQAIRGLSHTDEETSKKARKEHTEVLGDGLGKVFDEIKVCKVVGSTSDTQLVDQVRDSSQAEARLCPASSIAQCSQSVYSTMGLENVISTAATRSPTRHSTIGLENAISTAATRSLQQDTAQKLDAGNFELERITSQTAMLNSKTKDVDHTQSRSVNMLGIEENTKIKHTLESVQSTSPYTPSKMEASASPVKGETLAVTSSVGRSHVHVCSEIRKMTSSHEQATKNPANEIIGDACDNANLAATILLSFAPKESSLSQKSIFTEGNCKAPEKFRVRTADHVSKKTSQLAPVPRTGTLLVRTVQSPIESTVLSDNVAKMFGDKIHPISHISEDVAPIRSYMEISSESRMEGHHSLMKRDYFETVTLMLKDDSLEKQPPIEQQSDSEGKKEQNSKMRKLPRRHQTGVAKTEPLSNVVSKSIQELNEDYHGLDRLVKCTTNNKVPSNESTEKNTKSYYVEDAFQPQIARPTSRGPIAVRTQGIKDAHQPCSEEEEIGSLVKPGKCTETRAWGDSSRRKRRMHRPRSQFVDAQGKMH